MSTAPDDPSTSLQLLPGASFAGLDRTHAEEVIRVLGERLLELGHVAPSFVDAAVERERRFPTGLPTVIPAAIPHTDPQHVIHPGIAVATLADPVEFGEMGTQDGTVPVRLVVMLALQDATGQLIALQNLIGHLQDAEAVRAVLAAGDDEDLARRMGEWLTPS